MIQVILTRGWSDKRATLGLLKIVGIKHDPIFTLENPLRETSVDSRIPPGTYTCKAYNSENHHDCWELTNVPGRSNILIHYGNTEADTLGCIIVGLAAGSISEVPRVNGSKDAMKLLRSLLIGEFVITVIDERNYSA